MTKARVETPEKAKLQPSNPDAGDSRPKGKVKDLGEEKFAGRLIKAWNSRQVADLKARHRVGKLLNGRYGHPDKRQPYGDKAIERLKAEAGLTAPDVSLMRWFAVFGKNVGEIQEEYPQVVSWTAFKKALPEMKSDKGFKTQKPSKNGNSSARSRGVVRSLKKSLDALSTIDAESVKDADELRDVVRGIVKVMTQRFSFAISPSES